MIYVLVIWILDLPLKGDLFLSLRKIYFLLSHCIETAWYGVWRGKPPVGVKHVTMKLDNQKKYKALKWKKKKKRKYCHIRKPVIDQDIHIDKPPRTVPHPCILFLLYPTHHATSFHINIFASVIRLFTPSSTPDDSPPPRCPPSLPPPRPLGSLTPMTERSFCKIPPVMSGIITSKNTLSGCR